MPRSAFEGGRQLRRSEKETDRASGSGTSDKGRSRPPLDGAWPRQEANKVFALTSLLYGANAAYIEDLYAQYKENSELGRTRVAGFLCQFPGRKEDVLKEARGAPWKRKDWPIAADGDLVNAFDGNWAPIEKSSATS